MPTVAQLLLLPNHNLDPAYLRIFGLDRFIIASTAMSPGYTVMDNLLSQHYQQVLGYPSAAVQLSRTGLQFAWGGDVTH